MALKGTTPEVVDQRLKLLMFGPAGVGKTWAAVQLPMPYIIDTEGGTNHYGEKIRESGGAVFQTTDMAEVIDEVRSLMTEQHPYQTLVIDPFTVLFNTLVEEGEREVGSDFGRHYQWANKFCKRLFNMLAMLDMNVIVTCHSKNEYGENMTVHGTTFDGWKKLDYLFDLVIELTKAGQKRIAEVRKTRLLEFPDGDQFEWSYAALAERYGFERIEAAVVAVELATPEQCERLVDLIRLCSVSDSTTAKWLKKANATEWADMTAEQVGKCIAALEAKVKEDVPW